MLRLGFLLSLYLATSVTNAVQFVAGDLAPRGNPDGQLNVADLVVLTRIITGLETATPNELIVADVGPLNSAPDGVLDVRDMLILQRAILGELSLSNVTILPPTPALNAIALPTTTQNLYQISGTASPGTLVTIYINGNSQQQLISNPSDGSFIINVYLSYGLNSIYATESDGQDESTPSDILQPEYVGPNQIEFFSDDFETGFGSWLNTSSGDNNNWTRNSGGTTSSGTGPSSGSAGSTYYMYFETSSGSANNLGDTAILAGPALTDSNLQLTFDYHMYGADTGTLAVDVLSGGSWINDVWTISGQQHTSNAAAYTTVNVGLSSYSVSQIRFRATAAGGFTGDIAIDNLSISTSNQPDQDNDAVPDIVDLCPNTPTIETSNSNGCSPTQIDSDYDGVLDINDVFPLDATDWLDTDEDGLGDNTEVSIYFTDPLIEDSDTDGMLDGWEVQYGLNPILDDANDDLDSDNITNLEEFNLGTNPTIHADMIEDIVDELSLGLDKTCVIVNDEVICSGLGSSHQTSNNLTAPSKIGSARNATCALQGNSVLCWGESNSNLVNDLQANPINDAIDMDVGPWDVGCVITQAGIINCWGDDNYDITTPSNNIAGVQQVDTFQYHACSHNGETVECWGRNDYLQSEVPEDLGIPVGIAVGGWHSCALQDDQQVRCWGHNDYGQATVPDNLGNVVQLALGFYHSCTLNDAGVVNCWGRNNDSQLSIPTNLLPATKIYSGPYNVCANTAEGIVCWGRNDYGQSSIWYDLKDYSVGENHVCGINNKKTMCFGSTINEPELFSIPTDIDTPVTIGAGRYHTCLWANSGMHCWGRSGEYLNAPATLSNVTEIDGANYQTCALDDGNVTCWGSNNYGLLNAPTNLLSPAQLNTGVAHNCVIDGTKATCWGNNYYGQSNDRYNLVNPTAIAAGGLYPYPNTSNTGHSCVADDNGVQCWGSSTDGVLNVPVGLNNVIDLHAGWGTSCALQSDGVVSCWGDHMSSTATQAINIDMVKRIEGHHSKVCSQNANKIHCPDSSGAILLK